MLKVPLVKSWTLQLRCGNGTKGVCQRGRMGGGGVTRFGFKETAFYSLRFDLASLPAKTAGLCLQLTRYPEPCSVWKPQNELDLVC